MSKQEKFSKLIGQRLEAAHQEKADDFLWQKIEQERNNKIKSFTFWLSIAASVAVLGFVSLVMIQEPAMSEAAAVSRYQIEKMDSAIQFAVISHDSYELERLLTEREKMMNPQSRNYTL